MKQWCLLRVHSIREWETSGNQKILKNSRNLENHQKSQKSSKILKSRKFFWKQFFLKTFSDFKIIRFSKNFDFGKMFNFEKKKTIFPIYKNKNKSQFVFPEIIISRFFFLLYFALYFAHQYVYLGKYAELSDFLENLKIK